MITKVINTVDSLKYTLPNFVIIGVQKGGTSFLSNVLSTHPHISIAKSKNPLLKGEIHFFDRKDNWQKGIDWYRSHFKKNGTIFGEKTPKYIFIKESHQRMAECIPDAKLILLLRNPVTRAYSQWNMFRRNRIEYEQVPFEEALKMLPQILKRGYYFEQINSLLQFYPKKQLSIIISEKFWQNQNQTLKEICRFLDVPMFESSIPSHKKASSYPKPISAEIRTWLYKHYEPHNERLFEFLGEEIPEWAEQ